jgi:hypothetical protein
MMIYCSWMVAHVLFDGARPARSWGGIAARALDGRYGDHRL